MESKVVFIDANRYVSCVEKNKGDKFDDYGKEMLDSLTELLDEGRITLLLPEVIEKEIEVRINEKFETFKSSLAPFREAKKNFPEWMQSSYEKSLKMIDKAIEKEKKDIKKKLLELFGHKNTIRISLTTLLLNNGMKRAALRKSPGKKINNEKKSWFLKDIDCVAVESCLQWLSKRRKKKEFIICSSDPDYRENENSLNLSEEIKTDFDNVPSVSSSSYYSQLGKMMNEKFEGDIESAQIDKNESESSSSQSSSLSLATERRPYRTYGSIWAYGMDACYEITSRTKHCPKCGGDIQGVVNTHYNRYSTAWSVSLFSADTVYCTECGEKLACLH